MSAYIVSPTHISTLVDYAARNRVSYYFGTRSHDVIGDEARIASVLYAQNVRSVNARYHECAPAHGFKYRAPSGFASRLTSVEIIKACHGYAYQACETDDYESTEAAAIISAIERTAIRALPGYNDASTWHIDDVRTTSRASHK